MNWWLVLLGAFVLTGVVMTWSTFRKVRRLFDARPDATDQWHARFDDLAGRH